MIVIIAAEKSIEKSIEKIKKKSTEIKKIFDKMSFFSSVRS